MSASFPVRVAAIDAGSNAIRLVVADFAGPARYRVVARRRVPVRLGHRVFTEGELDEETLAEGVAALRDFREEMDALGVERYRAVGTSATREAGNRDRFLDKIRVESDMVLEPITGEEEVRLVHLAVSRRIDLSRGRWMLVDLGGGSVEVSLVDGEDVVWSQSHRIGTVRLLETLEAAEGCHDALREWVGQQLERLPVPVSTSGRGPRDRGPSAPGPRDPGPSNRAPVGLAATGGNIESIARLALAYVEPLKLSVLSLRRLDAVIHMLSSMSVAERVRNLGLRPDRADVILPAALVYRHFAGLAGVDRIAVPSVGVKDGVLLEAAMGRGARAVASSDACALVCADVPAPALGSSAQTPATESRQAGCRRTAPEEPRGRPGPPV